MAQSVLGINVGTPGQQEILVNERESGHDPKDMLACGLLQIWTSGPQRCGPAQRQSFSSLREAVEDFQIRAGMSRPAVLTAQKDKDKVGNTHGEYDHFPNSRKTIKPPISRRKRFQLGTHGRSRFDRFTLLGRPGRLKERT